MEATMETEEVMEEKNPNALVLIDEGKQFAVKTDCMDPEALFLDKKNFVPMLNQVKKIARGLIADVHTEEGFKARKAMNAKLAKLKTAIEDRGAQVAKELKAKHKAALDRKPKISKGDLKWFYDMVQKAIKHEETIVQSVKRMSEIRLECEKNHIRWTDEATRVLDKQRKSEDELAIVLHSIKEQLPILEATLAPVPKEKKCTSKK